MSRWAEAFAALSGGSDTVESYQNKPAFFLFSGRNSLNLWLDIN